MEIVRDRDAWSDLRIKAARLAKELGESSVDNALDTMAKEARMQGSSRGWDDRFAALTLLEQLGDKEGAGTIARGLVEEHNDSTVHIHAIGRLVALLGKEAAAELALALARDPRAPSRARLAAIAVLRGVHVVEPIAPMLSSIAQANFFGAEEAVAALAEIGAHDELLFLAREGDVDIETLAGVLSRMADLGMNQALRELANDSRLDGTRRIEAARMLARLGAQDEAAKTAFDIARHPSSTLWERESAIYLIEKLRGAESARDLALRLVCTRKASLSFSVWAVSLADGREVARNTLGNLRALAHGRGHVPETRRAAADALARLGFGEDAAKGLAAADRDLMRQARDRQRTTTERLLAISGISDNQKNRSVVRLLRQLAAVHDGEAWNMRAFDMVAMFARLASLDEATRIAFHIARSHSDRSSTDAIDWLQEIARPDLLLELIRDPSVPLLPNRSWAAGAFANVAPLVDTCVLVHDANLEPRVRVALARRLARSGEHGEEAITALRALSAGSVESGTCLEAAELLAELQEKESAQELLLTVAGRKDVEGYSAQQVVWLLARVGGWQALVSATSNRGNVFDVRLNAAEDLGASHPDEALRALLDLASDAKLAPTCRIRVAAYSLPRLGRTSAGVALLTTFARDLTLDAYERTMIGHALGRLAMLDELRMLASDETMNDDICLCAARALGRRGADEDASLALRRLLTATTASVRVRAALELGHMHGASADVIAALRSGLEDSAADDWTRESAAEALATFS